jgi:hypothetical protein
MRDAAAVSAAHSWECVWDHCKRSSQSIRESSGIPVWALSWLASPDIASMHVIVFLEPRHDDERFWSGIQQKKLICTIATAPHQDASE